MGEKITSNPAENAGRVFTTAGTIYSDSLVFQMNECVLDSM